MGVEIHCGRCRSHEVFTTGALVLHTCRPPRGGGGFSFIAVCVAIVVIVVVRLIIGHW